MYMPFPVPLPPLSQHAHTHTSSPPCPSFPASPLPQGQQRERQKLAMGAVDKAMYMFGQLVFGSQPARMFTFFYITVMHLLVFLSLMRMTHHSSGQLYEHQQGMLEQVS